MSPYPRTSGSLALYGWRVTLDGTRRRGSRIAAAIGVTMGCVLSVVFSTVLFLTGGPVLGAILLGIVTTFLSFLLVGIILVLIDEGGLNDDRMSTPPRKLDTGRLNLSTRWLALAAASGGSILGVWASLLFHNCPDGSSPVRCVFVPAAVTGLICGIVCAAVAVLASLVVRRRQTRQDRS